MTGRTLVVTAICLAAGASLATETASRTLSGERRAEAKAPVVPPTPAKGWQLVAFYLHGTSRCPTCLAIERQAKAAIEGDFARELTRGRLAFRSLNYEDPEHAHFADDYRLVTRSLVLSLRKDGREVRWKNLPEVWARVHSPDRFRAYVSGEVKAMLGEMR